MGSAWVRSPWPAFFPTDSSVETKTHSWGGHPRSRVGALALSQKKKKKRVEFMNRKFKIGIF